MAAWRFTRVTADSIIGRGRMGFLLNWTGWEFPAHPILNWRAETYRFKPITGENILMLAIGITIDYIEGMNRRRFLQSLAAVVSLPAAPLSLKPAMAALPAGGSATGAAAAAAAVPARAQFWAIYMSGLHGECTPAALQQVAGIPAAEAKGYLARLVADGVIRPNPLLSKTVSGLLRREGDGVLGKIRERLEMKAMGEEGEEFARTGRAEKKFIDLDEKPAANLETADAESSSLN